MQAIQRIMKERGKGIDIASLFTTYMCTSLLWKKDIIHTILHIHSYLAHSLCQQIRRGAGHELLENSELDGMGPVLAWSLLR